MTLKMLPVSEVSDSELLALIKECQTSGAEGAELNVWNEQYFIDNHMIKSKFKSPSAIQIKTAESKLINYFGGGSGLYNGMIKYFKLIMLAMWSPSNMTALLFDEFISSDGTDLSVSETTATQSVVLISPDLKNYQANLPQEGSTKGAITGLAEAVTVSDEPTGSAASPVDYSADKLTGFWKALYDGINSIATQGDAGKAGPVAITVLGLICMHSIKLITRTPTSTQKSMSTRMNTHFADLYKCPDWTEELIPVHIKTLESMSVIFKSCGAEVPEIVSILIGKIIIENANITPNQSFKGVLYGSCLTHIGMHGLAPVKHVEQTALALGLKTSEFCSLICTKQVKEALVNVCSLIKYSSVAPGKVTILGTEYNLQNQISWRLCRLYKQAHFQRFKTQQNTRLIIRCAAYLSETSRGTEVRNMAILSSGINSSLFNHEKIAAHRYIESRHIEGEESKALYGGKYNDPSSPF